MQDPAPGDMATERIPLSTQSMRLLASDLQRMDIAQLDPEALGNIKKLSVSLSACSVQLYLGLSFCLGFTLSIVLSSSPKGL